MVSKKVYTLVFVLREQQILLGLKKRGFGVNKWNGFGGKLEPNECVVDAAVRELKEECSLFVNRTDLKNVGHLEFTFEGEPLLMDVRVFTTSTFEGTPKESEEMLPKWFHRDELPFRDMWLDDKYWFPYILQNKLFYGKFHYQGHDTILSWDIKPLQSMEAFYEKIK